MIAYFNGKYFAEDDIKISPFDRGFQLADGVYEVIRWYKNNFFMFDEHIGRLKNGLDQLRINFSGLHEINKIADQLIQRNNLKEKEATIYIQVTRGINYPRRHYFPDENIFPTVFITAGNIKRNTEDLEKGVKVILEKDIRWQKCNIKSISLLPNVLSRQKAIENNAAEAVFYRDEIITEGSHTNFAGILDGILYTHPENNFILSGITRKVVEKICDRLEIPFSEDPINIHELEEFDEFFIVGTTVEITPVIQIDEEIIGDGLPGKLTKQIQSEFYKMIE